MHKTTSGRRTFETPGIGSVECAFGLQNSGKCCISIELLQPLLLCISPNLVSACVALSDSLVGAAKEASATRLASGLKSETASSQIHFRDQFGYEVGCADPFIQSNLRYKLDKAGRPKHLGGTISLRSYGM